MRCSLKVLWVILILSPFTLCAQTFCSIPINFGMDDPQYGCKAAVGVCVSATLGATVLIFEGMPVSITVERDYLLHTPPINGKITIDDATSCITFNDTIPLVLSSQQCVVSNNLAAIIPGTSFSFTTTIVPNHQILNIDFANRNPSSCTVLVGKKKKKK